MFVNICSCLISKHKPGTWTSLWTSTLWLPPPPFHSRPLWTNTPSLVRDVLNGRSLYGFSPIQVFMRWFRWLRLINCFWHSLQLNDFSPVWTLMRDLRFLWVAVFATLIARLQAYGFSPVWTFKWDLSIVWVTMCLQHWWQSMSDQWQIW